MMLRTLEGFLQFQLSHEKTCKTSIKCLFFATSKPEYTYIKYIERKTCKIYREKTQR